MLLCVWAADHNFVCRQPQHCSNTVSHSPHHAPMTFLMDQLKVAAVLNRVAVARLRQGRPVEALQCLQQAATALAANATGLNGAVLPAAKCPSSGKTRNLRSTWTIAFVFDGEITRSHADGKTSATDKTIKFVAMENPGGIVSQRRQTSTSYEYCSVHISHFDNCHIKAAATALSAILLHHVAFAYHQMGITGNCRHCCSQSLEKFEMAQSLLRAFVHQRHANPFHSASTWFRELEQISGHGASQLYSVVFGLAPAA
jgi:hypothetical protein